MSVPENIPSAVTDDEILHQLRIFRRNRNLCYLFIPLSVAIGVLLLYFFSSYYATAGVLITIPITIASCLVFSILSRRITGKMKEYLGTAVTRPTLEKVFEVENYDPKGGISSSLIDSAGVLGRWDRYSHSDFVKGKYKGVDILYCDAHLEEEHVTTDSNGNVQRSYQTIFRGQWLVCDFHRELVSCLRLLEKNGVKFLKKLTKSDIETENVEFNEKFQILTKDGHNAFYVLTPHFMERLLEIDKLANARSLFSFQPDKVHIALYSGRDSFELKGTNFKDLDNIRRKFKGELKLLTDILDELLSNEKLFKETTAK